MPKTLIKSRLNSNKEKPKIKQEININKSNLPPHLQAFKDKLLSGNGFIKYNKFHKNDYLTVYQTIQNKILDVLVGFYTL